MGPLQSVIASVVLEIGVMGGREDLRPVWRYRQNSRRGDADMKPDRKKRTFLNFNCAEKSFCSNQKRNEIYWKM
jgi:hypothetical protein